MKKFYLSLQHYLTSCYLHQSFSTQPSDLDQSVMSCISREPIFQIVFGTMSVIARRDCIQETTGLGCTGDMALTQVSISNRGDKLKFQSAKHKILTKNWKKLLHSVMLEHFRLITQIKGCYVSLEKQAEILYFSCFFIFSPRVDYCLSSLDCSCIFMFVTCY